jgi:putative ubiquitin-RnfH superfamily antitoxin RatB of RatAB toxin-antitoxin module
MSTDSPKYVEVIWYIQENTFHWVSIPLDHELVTVHAVLQSLPWEIDFNEHVIGIWGKRVSLDHKIKSGDRIEVNKPLALTPNQVRLRRKRQTD